MSALKELEQWMQEYREQQGDVFELSPHDPTHPFADLLTPTALLELDASNARRRRLTISQDSHEYYARVRRELEMEGLRLQELARPEHMVMPLIMVSTAQAHDIGYDVTTTSR